MIAGKNISKTFTGDPILQNVEFLINKNRKIGVVGVNGCGKTTLFKLILGLETPDTGSIQLVEEEIGYVPQEFVFPDEFVGEYLEKLLESRWEEYKVDILVGELEFSNYDPYQKIATLSEGQKMKLKLIEVLLKNPTTLLIDEPTNHLDIQGILWFENYIKNLDQSVVMISHDREFLNHTVDEIWEIENKKILKFVGDYDNYKSEKLKLINKWNDDYKRFLTHKAKLEKLLARARAIKGDKRGAAVRAAKTRIKREVTKNKKEKYELKTMAKVDFETKIHSSKLMVRFDGVAKAYGENEVLKDLSFEIFGNEKVWLYGPNGGGKTTIVKIIMGEELINAGSIKIGNDISIGYFAQKQTHLDYKKNLLEAFMEETNCQYGKVFGTMRKFLFTKDDLKKSIGNLSPGQRARFAFSIFAYNDYDFLILDEPTNHLDIGTKEVIEESLREFEGTLLLVSHDRYFVESVGIQKILNLNEGRIEEY